MLRSKSVLALLLSLMLLLPLMASGEVALQGFAQQARYQYVYYGHYPQAKDGEKQPILWRVLSVQGGVAYLLSDKILDVKRIHGDQWKYPGWLKSELHAWLQESFVKEAFSEEELAALQADAELGYVSLPSSDDIKAKEFGFKDDKNRFFWGTPWAYEQGLYSYGRGAHSPIFTRSLSNQKHAHRATKIRGAIGFIGVESDDLGVVPVIWLSMAGINMAGGSGTQKDPYRLTAGEQTP